MQSTYTPSALAKTNAKRRLSLGLRLGYGEGYTVSMMVDSAMFVDFLTFDMADFDAVKAWATDLYRAERNPNNRTARRFGV